MSKKITEAELNAAFYMQPEEIIDFFKSKGLKTSFDWHEVYEDAHAKAFTVAKMTELSLLSDTKDLLEKAIKEGQSYSEFKKEATNLFAKKGWLGRKEVKDPKTGEMKEVELGTPRRIKQIYDCNMRSSYAVGRYKEQLEEIDVAPYWMLNCLEDGHERPEHAAMHRKVFRADDPFWSVFYPPNGWGCRCYVTNLTKSQVDKMGLTVEASDGKIKPATVFVGDKEKETESFVFTHDGRKITLTPDAGWGTNLGIKAWGIDIQAWNKVQDLPEKIKFDFISKMASNPHNEKQVKKVILEGLKNLTKPGGKKEVAMWLQPEIFTALIKEKVTFKTPLVNIKEGDISHFFGSRKNIKQILTEVQVKNLYEYLNNPNEIWLDKSDNSLILICNLKPSEIIDDRDVIKINIKIDKSTKLQPLNYIGSAGRVRRKDVLSDTTKYKKIK